MVNGTTDSSAAEYLRRLWSPEIFDVRWHHLMFKVNKIITHEICKVEEKHHGMELLYFILSVLPAPRPIGLLHVTLDCLRNILLLYHENRSWDKDVWFKIGGK